ncbi:MAG: hypothetical protein Kow0059_16020 [Candidatus Sumerlaeia bacterium]
MRFFHVRVRIGVRAAAGLWLIQAVMLWNAPAAEAVIQPGARAPEFSLPIYGRDSAERFSVGADAPTTCLLVFVKPGDKHLPAAIAVLNDVLTRYPQLDQRLRRAVILSRFDSDEEISAVAGGLKAGTEAALDWPLVLDRDDRLYHGYRIIATPTVVIVGADGRVADVHPGYDTGLENHVRVALGRMLGVEMPAFATATPRKPDMNLQMGRRMAARGLWDKALGYYRKAAAAGPLPPEAQLELAAVHLELLQFDEFDQMIGALILEDPVLIRRKNQLLERAELLRAQQAATPAPPRVTR